MSQEILWQEFELSSSVVDLLAAFSGEKYVFLLESSLYEPSMGRYSFIGCDPFAVVTSRGKDHLNNLRKKFSQYCFAGQADSTEKSPFPAGIMGFLGYEYGYFLEKKAFGRGKGCPTDINYSRGVLPDSCFGFYDCIITVDHMKNKIYLSSTGLPELKGGKRRRKAVERLKYFAGRISSVKTSGERNTIQNKKNRPKNRSGLYKSNFTKRQYINAVKKALEFIRLGEIYQVNLAQRFCCKDPALKRVDPVAFYDLLRNLSPSCFGGYFDIGVCKVVSSSPERFLSVRGRDVETRPMKGTRPRGETEGRDKQNRAELNKSLKDKAELLMITDLERNDLGRVCENGSVRVKTLRALEEYRTVFQTTSTIEGKLRKGKDSFDLLRACFPGGSITGCPKIRAMEIIRELEGSPRSLYTGSMGYISFTGNMDFNILIRTLLMREGEASFHVGGGIVADSIPEEEYEETLVKAGAMRECLRIASRGGLR
ncbi:MAG: anthranilate synthase component I family protein [Candidatus Omnitrophica bacterium]|nr:anthranilate synthase component I family protein [Candidatus Omnitrophota bacterium]